MSLRTLERGAPSLFKNGASSSTKLLVLSALAVVLMVADARLKLTEPLRQAVSAVLYPLQWMVMQPVGWVHTGQSYFHSLEQAQEASSEARKQMASMALRATEAERLLEENLQLRGLLDLRPRLAVPTVAAEVMYQTPDSYTRRVVLNKGQVAGVEPGSPVMDDMGVMGQVTRVQPFSSEVTLLSDRDQAIPVMVARTGVRSVAYGDPSNLRSDGMELRFMPSDADVEVGDVLTTSGIDGVYPAGLPVARVVEVERRSQSPFKRIYCLPLARMDGTRHVVILTPLNLIKAADLPEAVPSAPTEAQTQAAREDKSAQRRSSKTRGTLPGATQEAPP